MVDLPTWGPDTWRNKPIRQSPKYGDAAAAERVVARLRSLPPLVFSGEIEHLRQALGRVCVGEAFLLHGGDCAERFTECESDRIVRKLKILLQMSLVLTHGARTPVVRLGRMAGQFAKPRSGETELVGGHEIPVYRGDLINDLEPTLAARTPDPSRMLDAYFHSAASLNFIRALVDGGFTDLKHPEHWQLDFMAGAAKRSEYEAIADRIRDAIDFFETLGHTGSLRDPIAFFTSHEGLHLPYEEALTRRPPRRDGFYNLGAHFIWIGDRTRGLDEAHVEYARGLENPIGVKIGPSCADDELSRLVEILSPDGSPGRLTLITRYGASQIDGHLPRHVKAVQRTGIPVIWSADPMHGNTTTTTGGLKTRRFDDILAELERAFVLHRALGTRLGGLHFELTGQDVTECVGGSQGLTEQDLARQYETGCDPRLNYSQSLEMAFLAAELLASARSSA